jgi:hypothetical protein
LFTIVRDPFERAYSAYNNKLVKHQTPFPALRVMGLEQHDSFSTFLKVMNAWPQHRLNDQFIPQRDLLAPVLAHSQLEIFRVETLATDWPVICDRIVGNGGTRPAEMPRMDGQ